MKNVDTLICSLDSLFDLWVMNSCASFHYTPFLKLLSNYISGKFRNFYLANEKYLDIVERGDTDIRTSNGILRTLHNMKHIPALKDNLVYVEQLDDKRHYITFGNRT